MMRNVKANYTRQWVLAIVKTIMVSESSTHDNFSRIPGLTYDSHCNRLVPHMGTYVELASIFFLLPGALTLLRATALPQLPVIPVLWIVALPAGIWLSRQGMTKRELFGGRKDFSKMPGILMRAALLSIPLIGMMFLLFPDFLFALPKRHFWVWLIIMICYPILSVFPQGIIYRAFFHHRYGKLFKSNSARHLVAASCFSFSHIFFLNPWALALTFIGGLFFSRTYERSGSVFLSNFEHAIYGDLLFTIGYGGLFLFHGTMALMNAPACP